MNKINQKESEIQSAICEYLMWNKVFFWRSNNIPAFEQKTGFYRPLPKYAMRGVPDIIVIGTPKKPNGLFIGLEVKSKTGKVSESQKEFKEKCEKAGGKYFVVRSISDVIEVLKSNNANRA